MIMLMAVSGTRNVRVMYLDDKQKACFKFPQLRSEVQFVSCKFAEGQVAFKKHGHEKPQATSAKCQNAAKLRHLGSFHLGDPKSCIQHVLCFQNIKCILRTWRCCKSSFAYAPQLALRACFQFKWPQL